MSITNINNNNIKPRSDTVCSSNKTDSRFRDETILEEEQIGIFFNFGSLLLPNPFFLDLEEFD